VAEARGRGAPSLALVAPAGSLIPQHPTAPTFSPRNAAGRTGVTSPLPASDGQEPFEQRNASVGRRREVVGGDLVTAVLLASSLPAHRRRSEPGAASAQPPGRRPPGRPAGARRGIRSGCRSSGPGTLGVLGGQQRDGGGRDAGGPAARGRRRGRCAGRRGRRLLVRPPVLDHRRVARAGIGGQVLATEFVAGGVAALDVGRCRIAGRSPGPAPPRRLPLDRQSPRQQRPEGWPWTPIHMLGRADALGGDRRSNLPVPGQGTQRRGRRLRGPRNLTRLEPGSARPATKAGQHPGQSATDEATR
jgi:hypothetical protein